MSVNLGSAYGSIELRSEGAVKGAKAAADAIRSIDSAAQGSGKGFAQIAQSGEKAGTQVAAGAKAAAQSLGQLGDAGAKAGAQVASGADRAVAGVERVAKSAQDVSGALDQIGNTAGIAGGVIVAGLGAAVKSATDLQTAVTRISTIAPDLNVSQVSAQLSDMSTRVAQSSTQLAESLNQIYSSIEINQADALKLTEQFAKGAVAASTDAETFGTAILGVMNAYGLEVDQASHLSDVFFRTLDKGVISGDQLATGLGQVTQSAKLAGVNFDTLGALIAGVTREGGEASVNVNNLANALNKIVTEDTQKGLQALGIQTKDATGGFRDIVAVLTDLDAKLKTLSVGERTKVLQQLFPDQQARAGISVLLGQLGTVREVLRDNATAAGNAEAAYQKMGSTAAVQAQLLKNQLVGVLTQVGDIALPGLAVAAQQISAFLGAIQKLPPDVQSAGVQITAAAAAILLLGSGAAKGITGIIQLVGAIRTLSAALPLLAANASTAALAIPAFVVALVALNAAAEATTGQNLLELGASIAKYGDFLGQAREETNKFAQAQTTTLPDAIKQLALLRAELGLLEREQAKLDSFSLDAFYDTVTGQGVKRNYDRNDIQKRIDLLQGWIHQMEEAEAAQKALDNPVLGPPAPIFGPRIEEAQRYQQLLESIKATQNTGLGNRPNAGALQAEANVDITLGTGIQEQLHAQATAAYEAQQALVAYQEAINQAAAANQTASSAIQSQLGPMTAALDALNAKRAAGIPLSQAEAQLFAQLPGAIGQGTNALSDLTIQAGRYQVLQQQLAAGSGQQRSQFSGISSEIDALIGNYNRLTGAIAQADSQMRALGSANAKLSSDYNLLGERITALQDKAKTPIGLSGDEQTELHRLLGIQKEIGDEIGNNTAKQRAIVEEQRNQTKEAQATEAAIKAQAAAATAVATKNAALENGRSGQASTNIPAFFTPPPPVNVPVQVDPASIASIPGVIAGIDVPDIVVKVRTQIEETGAAVGAKAVAALGGATTTQTVNVTANDQATATLNSVKNLLATIGGTTANASVGATDNASSVIGVVTGKLATYAATKANPALTVQDSASEVLRGAQSAIDTFARASANPPVSVQDSATGPLREITGLVNGLAGRSINIVANVDTSAAVSAISELRALMPSSPAEKGPFRASNYPNFGAVFDSLKTGGEDAVVDLRSTTAQLSRTLTGSAGQMSAEAAKEAAELASTVAAAVSASNAALSGLRTFRAPPPERFERLRDALGPIIASFAADGAAMGDDAAKQAGEYAEMTSKVLSSVSAGADALAKLANFQRPTDEAIRAFRDSSRYLIDVLTEVAATSDAELTEAAATYAESAGKVYASIGQGVEALTRLRDYRRPSDKALTDFRDSSQYVLNLLAQVAADAELDAVADAGSWAESAGKVFQAVGQGVDALIKLQDFERPTDQAVKSFRDVSQFLVNVIAQVAADGEGPAFEGAAAWAESAGKIFATLSSGVDALAKLSDFERPTDQAVKSFRDVAQFVVNVLAQVAADSERTAVAAAGDYAESAAKVLALVGAGAEGLMQLGDFARPTDQAVRDFVAATVAVVAAIARVAAEMEPEGVANAGTFADAAGKILGLVGSGAKSLNELATGEFKYPDAGQLGRLAAATREAVLAIAAASADINGKTLGNAADYAEGAGKVVALVGNGVKGFADLATFVAPSAGQIAAFKSAVSATVIAIAQAAKEIDADAVKAAGQYADGAGKAVSLLGGAVSAFKSIGDKDFVIPSKQAIDGVVAVTRYGVDQLIGIANGYDKGQLTKLSDFADAAGKGYAAIGAALDASAALGKEGRVSAADAIGQALSELQAGLGPLGQMLTVSQQYATTGAQIGANIAQAYNSIAGALPGYSAPQAALVGATVGGGAAVQVIEHRYGPQTVRLELMAENGGWIVNSLRVDGKSRGEIAELISDQIATDWEEAS